METRSRRKRCNSTGSNATQTSPVLRNRTRSKHDPARHCETPRPRKRVRFSDPGPKTQNIPDYSTGLTPALCRTSFDDSEQALQRTPSRASRRHSTPLPRRRTSDSPMPSASTSPEKVLHFTPLRQLLDTRTQRRIRRMGLSNEITNLEREKKAAARYERSLDLLLRERDYLKRELDFTRREKSYPTSQLTSDDGASMTAQDCVQHLEVGNERLRAQLSFSGQNHDPPSACDSDTDTVDTIIINDSCFGEDTILMSDSPDLRAADVNRPIPDQFALEQKQSADASAQTATDFDTDFLALSRDLEAAEKAKRSLFEACRSRLHSVEGTALERHLRESSPPSDFLDAIVPSLAQTLTRASDATKTLSEIHNELSDLGFAGASAYESIGELQSQFRAARLNLERIIPGETANAGLNDGVSTLGALVKRVETLVKNLGEERTRHEGSADRERALRGQFDTLLVRYESATKKIHDLEEAIASSAGDMLHTRMRMQELEREAEERVIGTDRLNAALSKYHDEVKGLEDLVNRLEGEKAQLAEVNNQKVSDLERRIADETESRRAATTTIACMEDNIRDLKEVIEQNRHQVCNLTAKVETIERQRLEALSTIEKNAAEHDQEVGLMNVRVAELNTALEAAKEESEKLSRNNAGLEEQLRLEVENRDSLLDKWVAEQTRAYASMKAAVSAERRKAKVRAANWELKSDELQSETSNMMGSEPITPVSMTRFVDVEVGRGKHRRRLDSGIGVLTEDELELDVDAEVDVNVVPSDPADL